MGQDQHLFDPLQHLIDQVTGAMVPPPSHIERWVSLIETRHAWCRQHNAQYYCVIAPSKHVVYADKLPPGVAIAEDRPIARLLAALTPPARSVVIYPAEALRDGRSAGETYFLTDTHWTDFGAYLAYLQLRDRMRLDHVIPPQSPDIVLRHSTYRRVGDLGIRLTPERVERPARVSPANADEVRRIFANFTYNVGQVEVLERVDTSRRRGVIFRDSYGSFMLPFLATHFQRLVAVAANNLFYDLLRSEKPDVVITQIAEHVLGEPDTTGVGGFRFPDDLPPVDFAAFSGVALPLVSSAVPATGSANIVDLDFTNRPDPVWSVGECTEMVLKCRVPYAPCELALTVSAFIHPPEVPSQHLDIVVNGALVGAFTVRGENETITCRIPLTCLFSGRTLRVELFHPDCVSPLALGAGTDERELSLKLHRLVIRAAS